MTWTGICKKYTYNAILNGSAVLLGTEYLIFNKLYEMGAKFTQSTFFLVCFFWF